MTIEIVDCVQGTEEWHKARLGIPTASNFKFIIASGKGAEDSKTRTKYLYQLAGERITGIPAENYKNAYMARGNEMEDDLRKWYAMMEDCDPQRVGFVKNGKAGCSPDSLIGEDGMLEIKTEAPHILITTIKVGRMPPEHRAQVQSGLMVTEREWCDVVIGYGSMPKFKQRIVRDEEYIKELQLALDVFDLELRRLVKELEAMK